MEAQSNKAALLSRLHLCRLTRAKRWSGAKMLNLQRQEEAQTGKTGEF